MPDIPALPVRQASILPTNKIVCGALAGVVSAIAVWLMNAFRLSADTQIPGEVASALTTVVSALVAYVVPPAPKDAIIAVSPSSARR